MYSKNTQILKSFFSGFTFLLILSLAGSVSASEQSVAWNSKDLDARWLPWIGSWHLVTDKINQGESSLKENYLLTISPGSDRNSVTMKGHRDDKVLVEEKLISDGLSHPLDDKKCSGSYTYSWSENGKRLLLKSESNCPGDPPRRISGMSIIDVNRDWLDIQLLQSGSEKAVSIRKYRNVDRDESIISSRFDPDKVSASRIAASEKFSISEIKELSSKVEPEVLEAALLETKTPFPINSKELIGLSDSGVDSRVVDLMVALSFPDKFSIGREVIPMEQVTAPQTLYRSNYYSYYCPILPWHWSSSSYMSYMYGYSYLGWYLYGGPYYPLWWGYYPPIYDGGGGGGGGGVRGDKGILVKGRGYVRVDSDSSEASPRYAQPRVAPVQSGSRTSSRYAQPNVATPTVSAPVQSSSSSPSGGSPSYSYPSGSSGGSVSTGPSSGQPGASPRGYSSGR
jgi:hypothetical protein